ncbi:16956_t:CDS:1 [Dentiscutata erythropus]|uniref:16956_t:CDS:1 n=1 Tax=Dentiscutata erythropus TaxID=1348616 RepID=A0A9N9B8A6_9GLOM|nr:16956_t:CDS:1 [Dentiscutata erythropus]
MSINILLTEILTEIFENIEPHDLHSCIFVNRRWCKIVIPILWRSPFHDCNLLRSKWKSLKLLARTCLLCLGEDKREFLMNESMPLPSAPHGQQPIFNYPSFFRVINLEIICTMSDAWVMSNKGKCTKPEYCKNLLRKTLIEHLLERAEMIHFINLDEFNIKPIINKNKNALNLRRLKKIRFSSPTDRNDRNNSPTTKSGSTFSENVSIFSTLTNNLQHIIVENHKRHGSFIEYESDTKALAELLRHQESLKYLELSGYYMNVATIFESLKGKTTTLTKLSLNRVDLNFISQSAITSWISCVNLKSIEIQNCKIVEEFNFKSGQQMFPNLKKLVFVNYGTKFPVKFIIQIIKSTNKNLEYIKFELEYLTTINQLGLINTVINYCPNLLHFDVDELLNSQIIQILDSCRKLKELKFDTSREFDNRAFIELAKHIPQTLKYLYINVDCYPFPVAFKMFVNALNNVNLKVFYISNGADELGSERRSILDKYGIISTRIHSYQPFS